MLYFLFLCFSLRVLSLSQPTFSLPASSLSIQSLTPNLSPFCLLSLEKQAVKLLPGAAIPGNGC